MVMTNDLPQPEYVLEEYRIETPDSVRGIVSLIESTLTMGGVQEILVRQGEPIVIKRFVRSDSKIRGLMPSSRNHSQELRSVAQIAEILVDKGFSPEELVVTMISMVRQQGVAPVGIFCRNRAWLVRELFPGASPESPLLGLEIFDVDDLPPDALLVGGAPADGLPLTYVVKAVLDLAEVEETPTFGMPQWRV